jgi:hypothetical protein
MPKISRVKLLKQIKVSTAWALAPALFDSKGRIRRDHVMVEGRDESHPEGTYFLEFCGIRASAGAKLWDPMRSSPPTVPSIARPNSPQSAAA